jgi:predicted dienelactone hydrolase
MHLMIRRHTIAFATVFGLLSLLRVDPSAIGIRPPNPSEAMRAVSDLDEPDTGAAPGDGDDGARNHRRFKFRVGHRVMRILVPSSVAGRPPCVPPSVNGCRQVDVHLWYPADPWEYFHAAPTEYSSSLYGAPLPALWDPLSWKVASSSAREGPSIFRGPPEYPVIVFSHGNTNAPIDYAFTLEDLASAGFVVAAPNHANNSQDDVRMDFANAQAFGAGFKQPPFTCLDGQLWSPLKPCAHVNVPLSMADRAQDITHTLNALSLSAELGNRVDLHRVGILGHSRGTVTALVAAGGSTIWGISPEPRIKALMGMAIGAPAITFSANISSITQPTLLVSGSLDINTPPSVSQGAFELLASAEKEHLTISNAVHRTFDSTYCQQMQNSAAIAQGNIRALLDRHTASGILIAPISGVSMDYCAFESFSSPIDVRPIVKTLTGFDVTETNVPTTGLTAADLRPRLSEMAVTFFEHVIGHPSSR